MDRETGDAIRISLNSSVNLELMDPTWSRLRRKVTSGSATSIEQQDFKKRADMIAEKLMNIPEGDLFNVKHIETVSYTHLRAHETDSYLVCRLLLEKKKKVEHREYKDQ